MIFLNYFLFVFHFLFYKRTYKFLINVMLHNFRHCKHYSTLRTIREKDPLILFLINKIYHQSHVLFIPLFLLCVLRGSPNLTIVLLKTK